MIINLIFSFIFTPLFAVALIYCGADVCNNTKQHTLCKYQMGWNKTTVRKRGGHTEDAMRKAMDLVKSGISIRKAREEFQFKYPTSQEPARQCSHYERTTKTNENKKALLKKINERRDKIASGDVRSFPSAENMLKLEWNEELAKSAQRWADQCVKQNNSTDYKDACRDLGQVPVGQNIATVYGEAPGLSPLSLVDVWYTELLNANASVIYRYKALSDKGHSRYDHFTQLVWALSSEVGCGGVKFKERYDNKNRTVNRLVCNFAPSGNILGEEVYSAGPPCSRCPTGSVCDLDYTFLCSFEKSKINTDDTDTEINVQINDTNADFEHMSWTENITESSPITEDENVTFDYISHYYDFTRQTITIPSPSSSSCKELLAVDEFIELLKKKLSSDPLLKEFLMATTSSMQNGNGDSTFTDPNVAVFVSKIYSKKVPSTTTKLPEQEYVNSTLLVDLVEAVIFRSGEKAVPTPLLEDIKQPFMDVSPVKIQAELAEVKLNHDFTGHYFFPEDNTETIEPSTETIDAYDETNKIPVSDVVSEIENLKRTESTKDFLEDIIESDIGTERSSERRKRDRVLQNDYFDYSVERVLSTKNRRKNVQETSSFSSGKCIARNNFERYSELLQKLAADLKVLRLNQRFHCSYNRH